MRTTLAIVCALAAVTQAKFALSLPSPKALIQQEWHWEYTTNIEFNQSFEEVMDEINFFTKSLYAGYNGFIRGFYREHAHNVVDNRCLGEWVTQNMTYLGSVWVKIWNAEFLSIPYDDAIEAAKDVVNLLYRNRDFCAVDQLVYDV